MRAVFLDYNGSNGEIARWGIWQVDDISRLPSVMAGLERKIIEIEPGEDYDLSDCYVDVSAKFFYLKKLRSFDAPTTLTIPFGERVELSGLPTDTTVQLNDETSSVEDGTLTLVGEMEANYTLTLRAPTYKPHSIEVEVLGNAA